MPNVIINGIDRSSELDGLDTISERIYWSAELSSFIYEIDGNVIANGGTYNYLRDAYNQSVCDTVSAIITSTCGNIDALIYINDIKWNLSKRTAEFQFVTSPFIQLIDNNKSIKVTLGAGLSKNLVDISAYTLRRTCTLIDPIGSTDATDRLGWRLFDAFAYIIAFVSDGTLSFASDYFSYASGVYAPQKYAVLMMGAEVRLGPAYDTDYARPDPIISFQDLYNDCRKLFNVGLAIEGTTVRIEPRTYWATSGTIQSVDAIDELMSELDRSQFYSSVRLGSHAYNSKDLYLGRVAYYGHRNEQYHLTGQCNIDNELDLVTSTLVFDTNAIMAAMPTASGGLDSDDTDENVMLIDMDTSNVTVITPVPLLPLQIYYNASFANSQTLVNWNGYIPFTVYQLNQGLLQLVRASHYGATQVAQSSVNPIDTLACQNDYSPPNFDTGGDYQVGTIDFAIIGSTIPVQYNAGYFTAPANDYYTINTFFQINTTDAGYFQTTVRVGRFNGTYYEETYPPVVIHNATSPPWGPPPDWGINDGTFISFIGNVEGSAAFYMEAGDIMFILVEYTSFSELLLYTGTVEIVQYGATYSTQNTADNMLDRYTFQKPISDAAWCAMKSRPFDLFRLGYVDGAVNSRAIDVVRGMTTEQGTFTMGSRRSQNA